MSANVIPRQRTAPTKITPETTWEAVAASSLAITHEARNDRRAVTLISSARRMLKALTRLGINVESPRLLVLPAGMRIGLTERESQVLQGMSKRMSNAEIGRQLFVSEETIKTHARRLFRKLEARDRAHAVAEGFRLGILY